MAKTVREGPEPGSPETGGANYRLEKLVFVDRLGLNRREFLVDQLVAEIVAGRIRVLGASAEFDDILSRVVGRIRVGRN